MGLLLTNLILVTIIWMYMVHNMLLKFGLWELNLSSYTATQIRLVQPQGSSTRGLM